MPAAVPRSRLFRLVEVAIILVVFAATVALRTGELDRTPSGGHEWLTAQTMIVHDIWYRDGGPAASYFGMRMNYPLATDKHINNASMGNHYPGYPDDGAGNYYYMSHAPLGVLAPYVVIRALGQPPSVLALQVFNLVIHLFCALLLFACVRAAMPMREVRFHWPAVLAGVIYLGIPVALWFHANVYFVEIFVQLPFIATVLATVLYIKRRDAVGVSWSAGLWLIAVLVAAACLSEWLGYVLALVIAALALLTSSARRDMRLACASLGGAAVAGGLFFLQYSLVVGPVAFTQHLLQQFLYRTWNDGVENAVHDACIPQVNYAVVPGYYLDGYGPLLPLLVGLVVLAVAAVLFDRKRSGAAPIEWRLLLLLMVLVALPPTLHHFLLPGFTAQHSYSVLKTGYALAVLAAVLLYITMRSRPLSLLARLGLPVVLAVLTPLSIAGYRAYADLEAGGIAIYAQPIATAKEQATDNDVLFLITPCLVRPQMLYLTGRNIKQVHSVDQAREWLKTHDAKQGLVLSRARREFTRITTNDD